MNEFETTIMQALLDGPGVDLATLRQQAAQCSVVDREHTGVGFYTNLAVPPSAPHLEATRRIRLGDVLAQVEGVQHGVGFVLWIESGHLACLEGYTFEEPLPPNPRLLSWRYLVADQDGRGGYLAAGARDLATVRRSLAG